MLPVEKIMILGLKQNFLIDASICVNVMNAIYHIFCVVVI